MWSFEIDPALFAIASVFLRGQANVTLMNADGAEFAERVPASEPGPFKFVSNLPYADYQRILLKALAAPQEIEGWYLMLQSDVARKLAAGPGDAGYGPLAVIAGGIFEFKTLRRAGRSLFWPAPRVESEFFRLRPRPGAPFARAAIPRLDPALRKLFAGRRKQLKAVARRLPAPILDRYPQHAQRRVESLDPDTLLAMAMMIADGE